MLTRERKKGIFEGCINAMEENVQLLAKRISEAKEGMEADNLDQAFGALFDIEITTGQLEALFNAVKTVHKNK